MNQSRIRREPPPFRVVQLRATEDLSPHMQRMIFGGPGLAGFRLDEPAASVRLLLPTDGSLVMPVWNGNEFLLKDGSRAIIRTFTPRRFDLQSLELHLDVVLHATGAASTWAKTAGIGDEAAISGPGRGYKIDPNAPAFLLVGDETAIPAICQLLEQLPHAPIVVHIAITHRDASVDLHRDVDVTWHLMSQHSTPDTTLADAIRRTDLAPGTKIWAAGEAAAMHQIRKHLFDERGIPRSQATVRGYWKRTS